MAGKIFDTEPSSWQELEQMVQQAFAEMGYVSERNYVLETVRGTVNVDVYAVKTSTPIPTTVLAECKYWDKSVPQSIVHGFRTVCSDSGAHFGLIISKKGFQSGAEKSRIATNVHLMDFGEFQSTFFQEWRDGAFVMLARMRDQLLPILQASGMILNDGTCLIEGHHDVVNEAMISGVDAYRKYSIFFGSDGAYSDFFIGESSFPVTFSDPRGDPREIERITVHSHREYLDLALAATIEATQLFNLPRMYFSDNGSFGKLIS